MTGSTSPIDPLPTEGAVSIACRSRSPHSPPNAQQAGSAGSRATNWLRGRGAALLALNVCVGRWQRTCNWLDVHSRMFGQRCLPLTAALTSPRRCHNEADAGGAITIYFRLPSAIQWQWHALHTPCTREVICMSVYRARAPRDRGLVWHTHDALRFATVVVCHGRLALYIACRESAGGRSRDCDRCCEARLHFYELYKVREKFSHLDDLVPQPVSVTA